MEHLGNSLFVLVAEATVLLDLRSNLADSGPKVFADRSNAIQVGVLAV